MAESEFIGKFRQAYYDAIEEIGQGMEDSILDAFDNEHGYHEDGSKADWAELSERYVNQKPPRGRGGSANPILNFEGDLRDAIKVVTSGANISINVTSQKQKARGKGDTISVAEISSILSGDRPHTNPSAEWLPGSPRVSEIFDRYLDGLIEEEYG
jgi:hypothetical protein|tara:strand:- start:302 stop:769 length:468 start_codon:yes stop_codon:yes gene_type:complete